MTNIMVMATMVMIKTVKATKAVSTTVTMKTTITTKAILTMIMTATMNSDTNVIFMSTYSISESIGALNEVSLPCHTTKSHI